MKRLISTNDRTSYTHMYEILNEIRDYTTDCKWLITNIEAYPNGNLLNDINDKDYIIISNEELLNTLEKDDFQWIWGVFSGFSKELDNNTILKYSLPYCDENYEIHKDNSAIIQHQLAFIEIDVEDSSSFQIVSNNNEIIDSLIGLFPNSKSNY